jgi:hypothetical protein
MIHILDIKLQILLNKWERYKLKSWSTFFIANSAICPPLASEMVISESDALRVPLCRVGFERFLTVHLESKSLRRHFNNAR